MSIHRSILCSYGIFRHVWKRNKFADNNAHKPLMHSSSWMVHRQEQDSLMQAAPVYPPQSFNVRHLFPSSAVVDFNNKSPTLEFHTKGNLYLVNQTRIIFVLSQKGFMRKIQIVIWENHLSYIKEAFCFVENMNLCNILPVAQLRIVRGVWIYKYPECRNQ